MSWNGLILSGLLACTTVLATRTWLLILTQVLCLWFSISLTETLLWVTTKWEPKWKKFYFQVNTNDSDTVLADLKSTLSLLRMKESLLVLWRIKLALWEWQWYNLDFMNYYFQMWWFVLICYLSLKKLIHQHQLMQNHQTVMFGNYFFSFSLSACSSYQLGFINSALQYCTQQKVLAFQISHKSVFDIFYKHGILAQRYWSPWLMVSTL